MSKSQGRKFPTLAEMEKIHILKALKRTKGKKAGKTGAARLLVISRRALYRKLDKHQIPYGKRPKRKSHPRSKKR